MSDLIASAQDAYRNACIDAYFGGRELVHRARDPRGQTAAEYTGIILLVSMIIVAIIGLNLHLTISKKLETLVNQILTGK